MNILDIIERDGLKLKKVGTEYQGPCPFCNAGTDRFHVHPDRGEHGSYWCRVCGKKGDAIQFFRDFKGMGYREACEYLGQAPKEMERKYKGPRTPQVPEVKSEPVETPRECKEPKEMWRERAEALVEWGHQNLINSPQPPLNLRGGAEGGGVIDWLKGRGLTLETVKRFRLGWNPGENGKDIYKSRSSWGLLEEKNSQGKPKKVWVPRGLIIPCITEGQVTRVRIRRPEVKEREDRFILIPGGYTGPMVMPRNVGVGLAPAQGPIAWVVVEAELDAILIAQEVGDIVGVMAMTNNIAKPDGGALKLLKNSVCILNAMDYDLPGAAARQWWEQHFEQCRRWPVPKAKDPGDYYKEGGDIREWVMAGLPPVFKVQYRGQKPGKNSPQPPLNLRGGAEGGGVKNSHIIEAPDGRKIYLTDDSAEYRRLQRERKIVFNSAELKLINPVIAERVLDAKEIWKEAEVVEPFDVPEVGAGLVPVFVQTEQPGQPQGVALIKSPEPEQGGLF